MTASPFDHPLLAGLVGDEEVSRRFAATAEIGSILRFEAALAEAQEKVGVIPPGSAEAIGQASAALKPDWPALAAGTARDGMVVPTLVKALRRAVGKPHDQWVHFGATSQDAIDTGLVLRLKQACAILDQRVVALEKRLVELAASQGQSPIQGRTRFQQARPFTFSDRIANWAAPLPGLRAAMQDLSSRLFVVQYGGPVGRLDDLDGKGEAVVTALADKLGLAPARSWHTNRDALAALAGWLVRVSVVTAKLGQDIALMAQDEIGEITLLSGGKSSSMAHKTNPVKAEILVTLGRFNAALLPGLHQPHEYERSGTAWTLEWMVLPQMVVATAAALRVSLELLNEIESVAKQQIDGPELA